VDNEQWRMRRVISSLHNAGIEGGRADDMPKDMTRHSFPGFDTPKHHLLLPTAVEGDRNSFTETIRLTRHI
jgi:hypothetical protein